MALKQPSWIETIQGVQEHLDLARDEISETSVLGAHFWMQFYQFLVKTFSAYLETAKSAQWHESEANPGTIPSAMVVVIEQTLDQLCTKITISQNFGSFLLQHYPADFNRLSDLMGHISEDDADKSVRDFAQTCTPGSPLLLLCEALMEGKSIEWAMAKEMRNRNFPLNPHIIPLSLRNSIDQYRQLLYPDGSLPTLPPTVSASSH